MDKQTISWDRIVELLGKIKDTELKNELSLLLTHLITTLKADSAKVRKELNKFKKEKKTSKDEVNEK